MAQLVSVGIDNGLLGAIVAIDEGFRVLCYRDTPTITGFKSKGKNKSKHDFATAEMAKALKEIIDPHRNVMVWLEQAQAMPQQGLSSTFKTGRCFGLWEGICIGLGVMYDIVHAKTWTKLILKDVPAGDPKARSMAKCQRLYPNIPLTKPRGTVLTLDGRADAALIATYGMMQMRGQIAAMEKEHGRRIEKRPPPRRG